MQFHAHLRKVTFPTPFVFTNVLSTELTAFQTRSQTGCVVSPFSTSQFALDEPLHIPLCLLFGESHIHISLIEDTDFIQTAVTWEDTVVLVSTKLMPNGSRSVDVTAVLPDSVSHFHLEVTVQLACTAISLLDLQTREFALLNRQV
jgi:hypothetical protein